MFEPFHHRAIYTFSLGAIAGIIIAIGFVFFVGSVIIVMIALKTKKGKKLWRKNFTFPVSKHDYYIAMVMIY